MANPGRPAPCSAKSIYRLADSECLSLYSRVTEEWAGLDLADLKDRAAQVTFEHAVSTFSGVSLTSETDLAHRQISDSK
jgi:hypothetical protein